MRISTRSGLDMSFLRVRWWDLGPVVGLVGLLMHLRDHIGDQSAPTRLVRRAQPAPTLAVEIFIEQDVVLEVRVCLHLLLATEDRPTSLLVAPEDVRQATLQLVGDLFKRHPLRSSAGTC